MQNIQGIQPQWPQDLASIGMSEGERDIVNLFMRRAYNSEPGNFKRGMHFSVDGRDYQLPRSLSTFGDGRAVVLLNSKGGLQPLGAGGQCTVKRAWELRDGRGVAKKNIEEDGSEKVYTDKRHKGRGIADVLGLRRTNDKLQVLEYQYNGTLGELLTRETPSTAQKLRMAQDLLHGLSSVHGRTHKLALEILGRSPFNLTFPLAHKDIKFTNILVNDQEAALTDFGAAGKPHELWHTMPFVSPELEDLLINADDMQIEEVARRNGMEGPQHDNWAMGLIICGILAGLDEHGLPDIGLGIDRLVDAMNIHQSEIDQIIHQRRDAAPNKQEKALWALAGKLLQTNPERRISSEAARVIVDKLVAKKSKKKQSKKPSKHAAAQLPSAAPTRQTQRPATRAEAPREKKQYRDQDQLIQALGLPTAAQVRANLKRIPNRLY